MPKAFDFANPPFDRLRPDEVERVKAHVDVEFFRKGRVILSAGDLPDYYYIVIKGIVEERAEDEIVGLHAEGDGFDSKILVHKSCRHDFVVREEAICYLLPIEDFIELTANNANFGLYFFQDLSQKLESLSRRQASSDTLGAMTVRVRQAAVQPAVYVEADMSLHDAALAMEHHGQRALLTRVEDQVGIVTGVDLTRAAVRDRRPIDTTIRDIVKLDLLSVDQDDFLFQAAYLMARRKIRHLVVRQGTDIVGLLDAANVLASLANQADAVGALVDRSTSVAELGEVCEKLTLLVRHLHENGTKIGFITELSSDLHRRISARLFSLLAPPEIAGEATLVVMGSEGRAEYLLKTDQDNGLILSDALELPGLQEFKEKFTDAMIEVGFPACPGEIMVRNPEWSRPVGGWRDALARWVREPSEQALMNVAIFYDASVVIGRSELLQGLKEHLFELVTDNASFQARFAKAIEMFDTPVGMFAGLITERGEHKGELDIKKGGIFPLMHGIRALALERQVLPTNTILRIRNLQELGLFDAAFARDLADAYSFMLGLRLTARLEKMRLHQPLDNFVKPQLIGKLERDLLKDSLLVVKKLRELVRHHFRLAVFG